MLFTYNFLVQSNDIERKIVDILFYTLSNILPTSKIMMDQGGGDLFFGKNRRYILVDWCGYIWGKLAFLLEVDYLGRLGIF